MTPLSIVACGFLIIYGLGVLYYLGRTLLFLSKRQRSNDISPLADILARIMLIIDIVVFWPLYLWQKKTLFT